MACKIFHIVTHFDIGGSETVALNISKSKNKDFEFHLVEVVRGHGDYSDAFIKDMELNGIHYHRSPFSTNFILGALLFPFWFWKIHKRYNPDVYHTHTESPDVALFLFFHIFKFMIKKSTKVVRTLHNTKLWKRKHFIGNLVEHFFLKHSSNISISKPVKEAYLSSFKFYNKEIPIIFNGIEEQRQITFKDVEKNKINILFAGRIVPQKGIDVLIRIIRELNNHENNFSFHIIGDGSLKNHLISSLANYSNVHIYGNIYNLASYLNSFDYLIMPSVHEGLSMLAIESSFAKLPIIINSCEGLEDTLPNDWPLKVRNNDFNSYLDIFRNLDKYNHDLLAQQAHDFVSERFGIIQMQEKYLYIYKNKKIERQFSCKRPFLIM